MYYNVFRLSNPLTKVRLNLLQHGSRSRSVDHVDRKTAFAEAPGPSDTVQICVVVWLMRCVHRKVKVHDDCHLFDVDS